jgi:penicillin-binding protein 1A
MILNQLSVPRLRRLALQIGAGLAAIVLLVLAYVYLVVVPALPALSALTDYQPKLPLRVFTADHVLIGEFGEERREFVALKDMPPLIKNAVLATEDDRFYEHGALTDMRGLLRAVWANLRGQHQGGGTITMQVARNFLRSWDRTPTRKLNEIVFALQIEGQLSKDQVLELYMNHINFGEHAYGFASAAQTYFGKKLNELTVAEIAMLAGVPQRPSANNPIPNFSNATARQQHVLRRLRELNFITVAQFDAARRETLHVHSRSQRYSTHAEYVAEVVRQAMLAEYKDSTYTRGIDVTTTITRAEQDAAYGAVRANVLEYDRRHGYRGPEAHIELPDDDDARQDAIDDALAERSDSDNLMPVVVIAATPKLVRAQDESGVIFEISGDGLQFAASALSEKSAAARRIRAGSVIRIARDGKNKWSITQMPEVAAAFVALDALDGSYRALVGGFDFKLQKFDHTRQAWRQPGSSMKPFIYSAALEKGFSPATIINDIPLFVSRAENGGGPEWEPRNDDGFDGPLTMRTALARSKNVPSVRILRAITPDYAHGWLEKFGFDLDKNPANLTMVLGSGAATPLQMAGAYAVFANGGYQVKTTLIRKVSDAQGKVLFEAPPFVATAEANRVLDARNAFVIDSMLHEVVTSGTGAQAMQKLHRIDLAGKTGTTSNAIDGWFCGYAANVVAVSWMGYDTPKSLGGREFGATLALPAWIAYMQVALRDKAAVPRAVPQGLNNSEGDWMFDEFTNEGAVKTLVMDDKDAGAVAH